MKSKFGGTSLDIRNVPNCFEITPNTPDTLFNQPLLNEFVIESSLPSTFSQKCCQATKTDRMRPYSIGGGQGGASRGAARPLVLATVLLSMILALIYFLINFPLANPLKVSNTNDTGTQTTDDMSTTTISIDNGIYQHLNNKVHRRQIPLIHQPSLYEIKLKLFLPWKSNVSYGSDDFTVEGHVRMHFVSGGGSRIQLHSDASEQHIGDCTVHDDIGREILVKHVGRGYTMVLDLHLATDMINGMNYTLDISFRGHISTQKQKGLFAVPYNNNGDQRYIVGTHLQMSEARTVFPCLDVPEVKAHFDTIIIHPTGTNAVANMMENNTYVDGGWTTTTFHRTPPMSTYLFAFSVSDFPFYESFSSKGVRTRVYCDPAKLEHAQLISNSTGPLIGYFEEYFGIAYPLDKLDVVILPALEVAAMENWGLITTRQADGLFAPLRFPITQKHFVQEVIAHEVAHQWFGNLVTMKWWNNLWLNEGFATMIGHRAVDFLENTTWRYEDMTAEFMCHVLREDQIERTHAVSINGDEEVQTILSISPSQKTIIYLKAAIITRMIERLVEEDIFRKGLNRFLNTFMYKNADHDDLFNVLSYVHDSSSGGHLTGQNFSLSDVMSTWLRQSSFPVVHVTRKEGSIVTLQQERYNHIPHMQTEKNKYVWKIPIFYDDPVTSKHKVFWITDKQPVLFDMVGQSVVDPHQLTYMRLKYDESMYSDITNKLLQDYTAIPTNSRSRLIDDSLAMAENGHISYEIPFNLTMYLPQETSYRPFKTFSAYLDFFLPRMFVHEQYEIYREYLLLILGPQFDRLEAEGFTNEADEEFENYKLKDLIVFRACLIGYQPCIDMALKKFGELKTKCGGEHQLLSDLDCNKLPYYLRPSVYSAVIEHGTQNDFNFLFDKWKKEHYVVEKDRIWSGLCASNDKNNSDTMWMELLRNRARESITGRAIACSKFLKKRSYLLDLMIDKYDEITEMLHKSDNSFFMMVQLVSRQVSTTEEINKMEKTLEKYSNVFKLNIKQRTDTAMNRVMWRKVDGPYLVGNATEAVEQMKKYRAKNN